MWNLLIPVLPASFMISPLLWRGICPLATLNQWSGGLLRSWRLAGWLLVAANALGILLLVLLVPARRFLLNENGTALAATLSGRSPVTGQGERVTIVTRQLDDEHLVYMLFITPERDAQAYSRLLNEMVSSFRVDEDHRH